MYCQEGLIAQFSHFRYTSTMESTAIAPDAYGAWVRQQEAGYAVDFAAVRAHVQRLCTQIHLTVAPLIQPDEPPGTWRDALASLPRQIFPSWDILLPEDVMPEAATGPIAPYLRRLATPESGAHDGLLQAVATQGTPFSRNYIVPLTSDLRLSPYAFYEFAAAACAHDEARVLFADEDVVDADGRRQAPHFKTAFDPELMLGRNAMGLPLAMEADTLRYLLREPLGKVPAEAAVYEIALRAMRCLPPTAFHHLPVVLGHREAAAFNENAAQVTASACRSSLRRHLDELGFTDAIVAPAILQPTWSRVIWPLPSVAPLVTIIIATRDMAEMLERCTDAVLQHTDYPAIEVLIVDNGSTAPDALALLDRLSGDARLRILPSPGPFNYAALNNLAAREARGEVLVLLNNDTLPLAPDWLRELVSQALRPEIGAVGARLLYPDGRIQHAGVVFAPGPELLHQYRLMAPEDPGPEGELALVRSVCAVTGACLAVRRAAFEEVGGLDEANLAINFNDVDLCLRLRDAGYTNICTPFAELMHFESATRGSDPADPTKVGVMMRELAVMARRWAPEMRADPFHSVNLRHGLSGVSLADPPRRSPSWVSPLSALHAPNRFVSESP